MNFMTREVTGMAEIDGEQYAARKLGCEISADPLNPLDPIKKVCKSHHPDEDLSILDRAYRRAVIQHSAPTIRWINAAPNSATPWPVWSMALPS